MHVTGGPTGYPLTSTAQYIPPVHTISDWSSQIGSRLGFRNAVLVQPSIYGTDNSCLIDGLRQLTPKHGRGVIELDPSTVTQKQQQEWHDIGIRGARVNLKSVGKVLSGQQLQRQLSRYARVLRPFDWVLELYVGMAMIPSLESIVPDLKIKVCIDHYGHPDLPLLDSHEQFDPDKLDGFPSLLRLLHSGHTWLKTCAPYRLTKDRHMADIEAITKALLREAPDRLVYATDWPHTRFEAIDPVPFADNCLEWCGEDHSLAEKLFRTNAEELWDVEQNHSNWS